MTLHSFSVDFQRTVLEPLSTARSESTDSGSGFTSTFPATDVIDAPLTDKNRVPTTIGRYALQYKLGEGGLGLVYTAHDPLLSRHVAIKLITMDHSGDPDNQFTARFLNEARAAARLNHPHIVTVFDAGTSVQGPYIAMELLQGKDLRQRLIEKWQPTPVEAALIIRRVADALGYAHSKGVIHRDIKPANIFLVGSTHPKVLDFGIARVAAGKSSGDTVFSDMAAGSPYYMAPEQLRPGGPVDKRCDVFSLGVVLYELLTGKKPFTGDQLADITLAVEQHTPPLASTLNPQVPLELSYIVARALEKSPDHRQRSARQLSQELRQWTDAHIHESRYGQWPASSLKVSRRTLWVGGAVAFVLMMLAAWWLMQQRIVVSITPEVQDQAASQG